MARLYNSFVRLEGSLHHQGTDKTQNCVEFRESGVDKGVGEHIVALAHTDDTVGAHLTLTDGRNHTDQADAEADAEDHKTVFRICLHLAEKHEERHETINTLGSRQCRQHQEAT